MNDLFSRAITFFTEVKAPDLKEKVNEVVELYKAGTTLEEKHRKLFGFILFSYSMNIGPSIFLEVEDAIKEIGVEAEFKEYAQDWINYSKSKNKADV